MHYKIRCTVCHYSKSNWQAIPKSFITPKVETAHTNYGIENKEKIVSFKPTIMIFMMMVFVYTPKEAMHYVFMSKPCHKFHNKKCNKKCNEPKNYIHNSL